MFTGIIAATGKIKKSRLAAGGLVLTVEKPKGWKARLGDSITVSGVCSTVKSLNGGLTFEYMPESLAKTNVGSLRPGDLVNLERSMRAGDRLDGHIVQGHVDTTGVVGKVTPLGNSFVYRIKLAAKDKNFMKYLAPKGSVAVEGISLTVVDVGKDYFTVHIIPYTQEHTNLRQKYAGDKVNLEFDVLMKYLARLVQK